MGLAVLNAKPPGVEQEIALSRDEILRRYRRFRTLSRKHHAAAFKLVSREPLMRHAHRLGIARGNTFVLDDFDEVIFAVDLAIHTAPPDRQRVIDRYVRSIKAEPESEEARVLEAMRCSRFTLLRIEGRHPTIGLVARDMVTESDLWLVDENLERSTGEGYGLATRLYDVGDFCMMAGVMVPLEEDYLRQALEEVAFLRRKSPSEVVNDRRFAEALYRIALADGIMERVGYRDVPLEGA